jgi:hypothetical protein
MEVRIIRDADITHPDLLVTTKTGAFDRQATIARIGELATLVHRGEITGREYQKRLRVRVAAGYVLRHKQGYLLVGMGIAEPYDKEAVAACSAIDSKLPIIQAAANKLDRAQATGERRYDASDANADAMQKTLSERNG